MNAPGRLPCDQGVMDSAPCDGECSERARPYVLGATILGSSMAFIDGTVVSIGLPAIQLDFAASLAEMQWVVNAYTLFLGALMLVGGAAGDRLGRRRIFAWGIVIFAIASALCGWAPDAGTLIAARALQGVGGAMLVPGSLAIIGAAFPKEVRGRAIGTWAAFAALTTAAGPVVGGWLVETVGWRMIFFVNLPLAAVALWLTMSYVPESRDETATGALDWRGASLAVLGFGAFTYGLSAWAEGGIAHPLVAATLLAGVILLAAFLRIERSSAAPMMPLGLFRSKTFTGANLLTVFLYFALTAILFLLPFNLIQVQGYSATAAGAAFLPFSIILGAFSRWSGGLVDRFGAKPPLVVGPLVTAAGLALFAVPGIGGSYWTDFLPAMVVMGIGMTVSVAPLTTTVMNAVEDRQAGVASGINNAASRIAGLLAVAVVGMIAIASYGVGLQAELATLSVGPDIEAELLAATANMAATEIPSALSAEMARAVEAAIKSSFVSSFRLIALITAAMAFAGGLLAWMLIEPEERASSRS